MTNSKVVEVKKVLMAPGQAKRENRWGDDWIDNQGGRKEERDSILWSSGTHASLYSKFNRSNLLNG
jgi:hypothetical protein